MAGETHEIYSETNLPPSRNGRRTIDVFVMLNADSLGHDVFVDGRTKSEAVSICGADGFVFIPCERNAMASRLIVANVRGSVNAQPTATMK
jgi:hypothetical protein